MVSDARNPIKDNVAFISCATTPYARDLGARTLASSAIEASIGAIRAAGLDRSQIDGICASSVPSDYMQSALGLPEVAWWCDTTLPFSFQVIEAINAVYAGACRTVLVYHSTYQHAGLSRAASSDPFRSRVGGALSGGHPNLAPETPTGPLGYAAWAARYLSTYGRGREDLGHIVLNSRYHASRNSHAVYRSRLSMEEYRAGRMVRTPLTVYDMDAPVDGGDAFVITTAERARDLVEHPVLIHAATHGRTAHPEPDQTTDLQDTGNEIVARQLWGKSDLQLEDIDLVLPYDGFSIIGLMWIAALGYCDLADVGDFLIENWDPESDSILINGRVPVNTHGGSLAEGGTQGAGHFREAVAQLSRSATGRQVEDIAAVALTVGGFLFNATGFVLRTT